MKVISQVYLTEDVAVISFENAPAKIGFLSSIFDLTAKAGINVDMISQTAPKGEFNSISFTVNDKRIPELLSVLSTIKWNGKSIKPLVSVGNVKISLYGEEMPSKIGVASDAFNILNENGIDIILITTSDVDVSILVQSVDGEKAYNAMKKAYL